MPKVSCRLADKVTLADTERDGEVLLLKDGRRLLVANSDDATVASCWFPDADLVLKAGKRGNVLVTNMDSADTVSAKWASTRMR